MPLAKESATSISPIVFGTSGWRGVLGEELTLPRLRAVVWGIGQWMLERGGDQRVFLSHDRRFFGERFVAEAEEIFSACGLEPIRIEGSIPTPVLTRAMAREGVETGLCFTASHNPPEYHGVKVFAAGGASAPSSETKRIEEFANRALRDLEGANVRAAGTPTKTKKAKRRTDLVEKYIEDALALLDQNAFERHALHVVYDAMHGGAAGVMDEILRRLGVRVQGLRLEADPRFGGISPEPSPGRLLELAGATRSASGLVLGLANDGDGDRYGALDADGVFLLPTQVLALLVDHLARTGRITKGISVSIALGTFVERVAAGHGLPVVHRPIGFKHMAEDFISGTSDLAGEESGGFALAEFSCDKDGILAGALLAEVVASNGEPLRTRLRELEAKYGHRVCSRKSAPISEPVREKLKQLASDPPDCFGKYQVRRVENLDGLRFDLEDGFLMFRASGTEPLVRIYAEAPTARALEQRFEVGAATLGITFP